jgi:hypothetical protein
MRGSRTDGLGQLVGEAVLLELSDDPREASEASAVAEVR